MHLDSSLDHQDPSEVFHNNAFEISIYIPEEILSVGIILNLHLQATHENECCRLLANR